MTSRPICPATGKVCWESERAAWQVVMAARWKRKHRGDKRRQESAAYKCQHCGCWHTTRKGAKR